MSRLIVLFFRIMLNIRAFKKSLEAFIVEQYRAKYAADLRLKTEIVKVKKGKTRYCLAFFVTNEGYYRLNIGRHFGIATTIIAKNQ